MNKVFNVVDEYEQLILSAEKYIWQNPEPGYKEFKTNAYMIENFEKLGYKVVRAQNITGFYTEIDTGREGPTVLVLAELDSLINFNHAECDKQTGAVHNCGHHAQCAAMLGLAGALTHKEIVADLCGKIKLCVVPAEEGIEISYRKELIKKGVIKFSSGKPEFISRGYFDDVDIAFMLHITDEKYSGNKFYLTKGHNGLIRKKITINGKSAHAGAHPDKGINALNAANLALLAVNSLRETFKESECVRIHSIITKGGDAVNAVPDKVVIESYVRAANSESMKRANEKVNLTVSACAAALGATVYVEDLAGSEPLNEDANLREVAADVCAKLVGKDAYLYKGEWCASSTDMGDVSTLVPSIHLYSVGAKGAAHGTDYKIIDAYNACVNGAKAQLGILYSLLSDGAQKAKKIIKEYKPTFSSVKEYLEHKNSLNMEKQTVTFTENTIVNINVKN